MIIINRALSRKKGEKGQKRGTMLLSFFHTYASKHHHDLHDRESLMLSLSYTKWKFSIIELGLYIPTMGLLKCPRSCEQASWMHTHLVSFVELSYIYNSSAFVAWQSLLLALTSIDGHLPSPLISRVDVRLSPFLSSPHNPHHHILFHP